VGPREVRARTTSTHRNLRPVCMLRLQPNLKRSLKHRMVVGRVLPRVGIPESIGFAYHYQDNKDLLFPLYFRIMTQALPDYFGRSFVILQVAR
jgi:hypothetical protein